MFSTFLQSVIVGFSEFLATLCTAKEMSGLVALDKNISIPIALLYVVLSILDHYSQK